MHHQVYRQVQGLADFTSCKVKIQAKPASTQRQSLRTWLAESHGLSAVLSCISHDSFMLIMPFEMYSADTHMRT